MIKLTRLGGEEFVVNAELIRTVESRPDTFVTLTTNDRFIVRESVAEVVKRTLAYRRLTTGNFVEPFRDARAA